MWGDLHWVYVGLAVAGAVVTLVVFFYRLLTGRIGIRNFVEKNGFPWSPD